MVAKTTIPKNLERKTSAGRNEMGNDIHFVASVIGPLISVKLFYMDPAAGTDYAAFQKRVKRTVYLDNLSPQVTEAVIRTAFDQFGKATSIQFIPNYLEPKNPARCALVELQDEHQVTSVIEMLTNYPFMMAGMPRPVRICAAEAEMFAERPVTPGRRIQLYWADPKDPEFAVAQKFKRLAKQHSAEAAHVLKHQLEEEEKLSKQQAETLKAIHRKYDTVETVLRDGTCNRLARYYKVELNESSGF
ncbi:hypothetical protein Nepgr_001397 [Nepenthes gracilis]|uniref:RRM domain-containing protein n=1 Tax=Nepenthes gracilis TaxID=150966 RepID=A0AAD3P728_NEPGR|nr:hypothetical protein Nepgr_001397 [Nepenthes gracilis]